MKKWTRHLFCALYYGLAQHLPSSSMPLGNLSRRFRARLCGKLFFHCGREVNIESGVFFHSGRQISIGDYSGIGMNARLSGRITIGDNVMMGQEVLILTRNHEFSRTDIPMRHQGMKAEKSVRIGNDVWIGARVIILPGVEVGDGAVLGAGAVIAKDVPPCAVVVGNPARIIRFRVESQPAKRQRLKRVQGERRSVLS
ncbi:MAG: acetyltransferase [Desulfobacteraceae bacterium]|nr:MAG: acetyltransferase [Desulfobacteraceae bacterium]